MKPIIKLVTILMITALVFAIPGCGSGHKSSRDDAAATTPNDPGTTPPNQSPPTGSLQPPAGESSSGSGGDTGVSHTTSTGVSYNLIVPGSYSDGSPNELLIVYSGTEGAGMMTQNLMTAGSQYIGSFICAVLDGPSYRGNGQAGADVLDDVRAGFNIDNDRTCLLGESAGTGGAASLANLRQSYFAAYWANDITSEIAGWSPAQSASELGFAPHGNVGPGGQTAIAQQVVDAMAAKGYRLPPDAPYSGPGCNSHGDPSQFFAALQFFPGKTRQ
ncbi:MAG: hypothetical protein ACYS8W_16505 [Planctomycetota bacterium]|jgi:hypothetical protein